MVPTGWSKALEHLVGYAVERGVSRDAMLAHLAISAQSLADPEVRFPILRQNVCANDRKNC
jgi:hypothetical protein